MINFIKYRFWFFAFSGILLALSLYFILFQGFVFSIEFTGGTSAQIQTNTQNKQKIVNIFNNSLRHADIQKTSRGVVVKGKGFSRNQLQSVLKKDVKIKSKIVSFENIGPSMSGENTKKMIIAFCLAALGILLYVAVVFRGWAFAFSAIIAMVHDTIILLGSWAFLGFVFGVEFDVLFVTAVLTIMSFSVHDTIVIFDKLREEDAVGRIGSLESKINIALSLTMTRSINNSLTIILMLSALFFLGGGSIQWFALSLLIGTILGTYSSPFVAAPVYFEIQRLSGRKSSK